MQKIVPHIWFEKEASEAARWYVSVFKGSKILFDKNLPGAPSGTANVLGLELMGQEFQFLSAGPLFDRNPSFSYMVSVSSVQEVDELWKKLSPGSTALMPLDRYSFCERYGWMRDKFGVSWQIMHDGGQKVQAITPSLLFTGKVAGKAEEAMKLYLAQLGGALIPGHLARYEPGQEPNKAGWLMYARFKLGQQEFVVMDSADPHAFTFNEMQSLMLYVKTQAELDRYSNALSAVPEAEQCGWIKDKFGISWQIVPGSMDEMMKTATPEQAARLVEAFLPMKRFNIAALERAFHGK